MPIEIIAEIVPKNGGTFATHESTFGKGGYHEVTTLVDRDNITGERRVAGMACYVVALQQMFILSPDLSTWTVFAGGSGGTGVPEAPTDGKVYVRQDSAWQDLSQFITAGIYA